jgi:hypothetical protein
MRDDKAAKDTLWINQVKTQRERTVQDVLIQSESLEFNEFGHAVEKSMQPSRIIRETARKIAFLFPVAVLLHG